MHHCTCQSSAYNKGWMLLLAQGVKSVSSMCRWNNLCRCATINTIIFLTVDSNSTEVLYSREIERVVWHNHQALNPVKKGRMRKGQRLKVICDRYCPTIKTEDFSDLFRNFN